MALVSLNADGEALNTVLFIVRLGAVTILIWVLSRLFDLWQAWDRRRKSEDAFLRSVYAEVAFNTYDMSRFLSATVSVDELEKRFADPSFVPHITDARHTDIYRSSVGDLHALAPIDLLDLDLVGETVRFYGELEKITQQIEGLSKQSFGSISAKGKAGTISRIYLTCGRTEKIGKSILGEMRRRFPHLDLRSNASRWEDEENASLPSREELGSQLRKLQSDLDRINNTRHKSSPS